MKEITLVTTFHREGYETYGERMVSSFCEHAPANVKIVAYAEEFTPAFQHERVEYRDLHKECVPLVKFKQKFGRFSESRGNIFNEGKWIYAYQYDAVRFSNKVYTVAHAGKSLTGDLMFWVDADVIATQAIPEGFLEGVMKDAYTCFLGRENMYTECGFVGYDLTHPQHISFMQAFENIFSSGDIFLLDQWHDCMAYDLVRQHFVSQGAIKENNLSAHLKNNMHPFVNTELGLYMDHLKGPQRKVKGASFESDYVEGRAL